MLLSTSSCLDLGLVVDVDMELGPRWEWGLGGGGLRGEAERSLFTVSVGRGEVVFSECFLGGCFGICLLWCGVVT